MATDLKKIEAALSRAGALYALYKSAGQKQAEVASEVEQAIGAARVIYEEAEAAQTAILTASGKDVGDARQALIDFQEATFEELNIGINLLEPEVAGRTNL